jgi:hemolysin activation/secretion protein
VVDLGLNARRATSFFDGDKTGTTDVRSAALGLNFDKYDRYGRTFARSQATFAPEWLGANTRFFKVENYFTRVTRLPKNNLLILRAYSQWTPDDLPPIEQFQLGGINSVRGYTQGLLIGDRGYNINAEWRWPVPGLRHVNPWLGERIQGAFFFDYGQAWLDKSNRYYIAGVSNARNRTSLMGAGVGVRAHLTDYMQGYADFAFGLLDRKDVEPNAQPTVRVHFGVRSELLPNDYKSRTDVVTPIKTNVPRPRSVGAIREEDLQSEVADPTLEPIDVLRTKVR